MEALNRAIEDADAAKKFLDLLEKIPRRQTFNEYLAREMQKARQQEWKDNLKRSQSCKFAQK